MCAPCALHAQGHEQGVCVGQPSQAVAFSGAGSLQVCRRPWCVGGVWQDPCCWGDWSVLFRRPTSAAALQRLCHSIQPCSHCCGYSRPVR